jgi:hypothetical protein
MACQVHATEPVCVGRRSIHFEPAFVNSDTEIGCCRDEGWRRLGYFAPVTETELFAGDIVRVEFDREAAHLAELLDGGWSPHDESGIVATQIPTDVDLSDDFSAGALVIEFVIATASGITSGVIASLLTARLLGQGKDAHASIESLPVSDGATERLRLRVKAEPDDK